MIWTIIITLFILINVKTFFKCLKFKLIYKEKAIFVFFPIFGIIAYSFCALLFKGDFLYPHKYLAKRYPHAKIIVINFLLECFVFLVDPSLVKDFTQRHNEFHKRVAFPDIVNLNKGLLMSEGSNWKQ
jgi:hypothetical protein